MRITGNFSISTGILNGINRLIEQKKNENALDNAEQSIANKALLSVGETKEPTSQLTQNYPIALGVLSAYTLKVQFAKMNLEDYEQYLTDGSSNSADFLKTATASDNSGVKNCADSQISLNDKNKGDIKAIVPDMMTNNQNASANSSFYSGSVQDVLGRMFSLTGNSFFYDNMRGLAESGISLNFTNACGQITDEVNKSTGGKSDWRDMSVKGLSLDTLSDSSDTDAIVKRLNGAIDRLAVYEKAARKAIDNLPAYEKNADISMILCNTYNGAGTNAVESDDEALALGFNDAFSSAGQRNRALISIMRNIGNMKLNFDSEALDTTA